MDSDTVINFRLKENTLKNALLGDIDMPYEKVVAAIEKNGMSVDKYSSSLTTLKIDLLDTYDVNITQKIKENMKI